MLVSGVVCVKAYMDLWYSIFMSGNILKMETFFMALADRTRLRILNLIRDDEICVCYFTEALQEPQPKISRHLAYLRRSGVVETIREGKWIYYRIKDQEDERAAKVLNEIQNWMSGDEQMKRDVQRMTQICCSPEQAPISIQRAPRAVKTEKITIKKSNDEVQTHIQRLEDYLL